MPIQPNPKRCCTEHVSITSLFGCDATTLLEEFLDDPRNPNMHDLRNGRMDVPPGFFRVLRCTLMDKEEVSDPLFRQTFMDALDYLCHSENALPILTNICIEFQHLEMLKRLLENLTLDCTLPDAIGQAAVAGWVELRHFQCLQAMFGQNNQLRVDVEAPALQRVAVYFQELRMGRLTLDAALCENILIHIEEIRGLIGDSMFEYQLLARVLHLMCMTCPVNGLLNLLTAFDFQWKNKTLELIKGHIQDGRASLVFIRFIAMQLLDEEAWEKIGLLLIVPGMADAIFGKHTEDDRVGVLNSIIKSLSEIMPLLLCGRHPSLLAFVLLHSSVCDPLKESLYTELDRAPARNTCKVFIAIEEAMKKNATDLRLFCTADHPYIIWTAFFSGPETGIMYPKRLLAPARAAMEFSNVTAYYESCAICLQPQMRHFVKTTCGHVFHRECIYLAMRTNFKCPLCRAVLG